MDSAVEIAKRGTERENAREGLDNSWAMIRLAGDPDSALPSEVAVHGTFYGSFHGSLRGRSFHSDDQDLFDGTVKVRHLSRLWQYRNGRSPPDI